MTHFTDSDATNASWSPDSKSIGFLREWGPNKVRLYTMNADGTGMHALRADLRGWIAWFPDGKHLLVLSSSHWTIVTAQGTQPRFANMPGSGQGTCIVPDGKRAVFIASAGRGDGKAAIFVAQIGGGNGSLKRITPWETFGDKVDCSPDGTRVAFSTAFGAAEVSETSTRWVSTARVCASSRMRQAGRSTTASTPGRPDGKKLAIVSNKTGTYEIYSINPDGTGMTQITRGPEAHLASWGSHQ